MYVWRPKNVHSGGPVVRCTTPLAGICSPPRLVHPCSRCAAHLKTAKPHMDGQQCKHAATRCANEPFSRGMESLGTLQQEERQINPASGPLPAQVGRGVASRQGRTTVDADEPHLFLQVINVLLDVDLRLLRRVGCTHSDRLPRLRRRSDNVNALNLAAEHIPASPRAEKYRAGTRRRWCHDV